LRPGAEPAGAALMRPRDISARPRTGLQPLSRPLPGGLRGGVVRGRAVAQRRDRPGNTGRMTEPLQPEGAGEFERVGVRVGSDHGELGRCRVLRPVCRLWSLFRSRISSAIIGRTSWSAAAGGCGPPAVIASSAGAAASGATGSQPPAATASATARLHVRFMTHLDCGSIAPRWTGWHSATAEADTSQTVHDASPPAQQGQRFLVRSEPFRPAQSQVAAVYHGLLRAAIVTECTSCLSGVHPE
jgi:hypothetical protein